MARRSGSVKLFDLFGIRVGVHLSWFLILFLLIVLLGPAFRQTLGSSQDVAYLTTVVTVLMLFVSLIIHELGHALAARRQGIKVSKIDLFALGGFTQMGRDSVTPGEEFKIAAAGPLATAGFVVVCLGLDLAIVGPHRLVHAARLDGGIHITPVLLALSWLLFMNLAVLAFNLVPAFPLDGGRIVRAIVWRITGDKTRGTRVSAQAGQGFALILGGFGLWLAMSVHSFGSLWLIVLAFFIWQGARGVLVQTAFNERIAGVRVIDIMDRHPVAIPTGTPVGQALDEYFLRYGWSWFPIVDELGRFMGIARQDRVQAIYDGGEGWLTVGAVIDEDKRSWRVEQDRPVTDLLSSESLGRLGAVMAVDGEDILRGVVTIEQVRRVLQSGLGSTAA